MCDNLYSTLNDDQIFPHLLTKNTYSYAIEVANSCFPASYDRIHFEQTYKNFTENNIVYIMENEVIRLVNYFVYFNQFQNPIGISGIYKKEDIDDIYWLGWFGVHSDHRKHSYGSKILDHATSLVRLLGGTFFKLYTSDSEINREVWEFYERRGFELEYKDRTTDEFIRVYKKKID